MSTVEAYIGRTVDVSAFQGQRTVIGTVTALQQTLAQENKAGEIITGIVKLAQRWTVEFLTERGSILYEPNRGTLFYTYARLGFLRTVLEAEQQFASANIDVRRRLLEEETGEEPLDERYLGSELLSIALVPGLLTLNVRVVSRAGTSREVILPIDVTIGGFGSSA